VADLRPVITKGKIDIFRHAGGELERRLIIHGQGSFYPFLGTPCMVMLFQVVAEMI
jgi:hypothetical protein